MFKIEFIIITSQEEIIRTIHEIGRNLENVFEDLGYIVDSPLETDWGYAFYLSGKIGKTEIVLTEIDGSQVLLMVRRKKTLLQNVFNRGIEIADVIKDTSIKYLATRPDLQISEVRKFDK